MSGCRVLGEADRPALLAFLERSIPENLFLLSRIAREPIGHRRTGRILGVERSGELTAVCLDGGTLFVTGSDAEALQSFVVELGRWRCCSSLVGPVFAAMGLYLGLAGRWGGRWDSVANIRRQQPVMILDHAPEVRGDPRVQRLGLEHFDSYLRASVEMYTDEIGSSPFQYGPGYERQVRARLEEGTAYGIVDQGRVIFKADLGPTYGTQAQLQGVWLDKDLRGQGLSEAMLAGMLQQAQQHYPQISLYVNDFNTAAVRAYERLGFAHVGALATVHY